MANILMIGNMARAAAQQAWRETTDGHEVHEVGSVAEALRVLEGLIFDLILVTAPLPAAEGAALRSFLHEDSVHSRTAVVAAGPALEAERPVAEEACQAA